MEKRRAPREGLHPKARPPNASEAGWDRAWELAFAWARRLGFDRDAAEDCAAQFVQRLGECGRLGQAGRPQEAPSEAYLQQAAHNFALNCCRADNRRKARESEPAEVTNADGDRVARECADPAPSPEACMLRKEFWVRVTIALQRLQPIPRELLLRHHLEGESSAALGLAYGQDSHAVEELLRRARQRLREILGRMGVTEADLREYLACLAPASNAPPRPRPNGDD